MKAINYVKEIDGDEVTKLTASGLKLAEMAVAEHGGIRKTAKKTKLGVSTITKIVNGGERGVFTYRSWERFFNAILELKAVA